MKSELKDMISGLCRVMILSMLIFCPLRDINSQESDKSAGDETISEGYDVIRDARDTSPEPAAQGNRDAGEEDAAQQENPEEAKGTAPASAPEQRTDSLTAKQAQTYDSAGKRDPFKPFLKLVDIPVGPATVIRPPIQRYPLNQFRITGIVWIGGQPQAMIVDPEANTYFLGVGDKIGDKDGEILEVRESGLLVQERTRLENVYGEVKIEVKKSVLAFQNEER